MDNLYYVLIIHAVILFSVIASVLFVAVKLVRKIKFTKKDFVLILLLLICAYLYLPFYYYKKGLENNYPENYIIALDNYNKALKLSVIPFEKRLIKFDIGSIYFFYEKDGNKAIENIEYALKGDNKHLYFLPYLYFLKGDYDKVKEMEEKAGGAIYYTALSDIMTGDYDKSLNILLEKYSSRANDLMLISALFDKLGEKQKSQEFYNSAVEKFNQMQFVDETQKTFAYDLLIKYSDIDSFEKYILEQRKVYKFE